MGARDVRHRLGIDGQKLEAAGKALLQFGVRGFQKMAVPAPVGLEGRYQGTSVLDPLVELVGVFDGAHTNHLLRFPPFPQAQSLRGIYFYLPIMDARR